MTTFYVLDKDNRIIAKTTKKEILIKLYAQNNVLETEKEIVLFNNQFRFLEDIKEEYIQELKERKIKEIDIFIKDKVKKEVKKDYNFDLDFNEPITLNRLLEVRKTLNKNINEIFNIIENIYTKYSVIKEELNNKLKKMKSIKKIKEFNFNKEDEEIKKEEEIMINLREELTK